MRGWNSNINSNNNNINRSCSHVVISGIQSLVSLVAVFQLCCAFLCLPKYPQHSIILVESWSPNTSTNTNTNVFPFSTTHRRHPTIAVVTVLDGTEQRKSNRQPFHFGAVSTSLAASKKGKDMDMDNDDKEKDDDDNDDDDEPKFIEVESLSASQVMELIELSFVQACFALSKGDIEPLKLFVVAVTTASKKYGGAVSAMALVQTVDALPPSMSMRPLEPQERELRETWIRAIYLMMGHVLEGFHTNTNTNNNDNDEVANIYGPILVDLVAIHRTGMGLNVNQFVASRNDVLLPKGNVLVLEDGPEDDDLMRLAVVTQTINVLFTTLVVLVEDDDEDDDSSDATTAAVGEEEMPPSKSSSVSSTQKKKKNNKTGSSGRGFG